MTRLERFCRGVRHRACFSILIPLILVLALPGAAQNGSQDLADASLEDLMRIEVYSASKHLQSASEAPSSVTVITVEEIQRHGYRTLADILRTVRGFYISYDRSYAFVGVRGYGAPGDFNTRVLLLVDGHRINDNVYDQAMLGTEFPIDVDLIERIEIVRGPSSSLYGSNAFFGVINVITKRGHDINGLELSFEPASFGTYKGRTTYGGNQRGLEFLLSGTFSNSSGQDLFYPEFNDPSTNNGIAHNLDYDRYHDFLLTLGYRGFTLQGVASWRNKGLPTASFETAFNDPRGRQVDQHQYLDLSYTSKLGSAWQIMARTYYDRYTYDGFWPYSDGQENVDYVRGQRWGGELQFSRTILRKHGITLGSEFHDNLQQDQRNYDLAPSLLYVDDHRSSWMWAGFVQDEYRILPGLTVNAGVRTDVYKRYGSTTNPRVGLIYRPWNSTSLKLLYGTAFRAPTVYEAYYGTGTTGNTPYELNPNLGPEWIRSVEGIWEQELGQRAHLSLTVFRNGLHGLIALEEKKNEGILVFRNESAARTRGVELELERRFAAGVDGRLSYTFTDAENAANNHELINSPRHIARMNLTTALFRQRLFGGFDAYYESRRRTLAGNHTGSYPTFDFTLLGHALNNRLDLSASVYNLLNRPYATPGSPDLTQDTIQQDGRSIRVKLTWHLGGKN